jgi:hypothetical protein
MQCSIWNEIRVKFKQIQIKINPHIKIDEEKTKLFSKAQMLASKKPTFATTTIFLLLFFLLLYMYFYKSQLKQLRRRCYYQKKLFLLISFLNQLFAIKELKN